MSAFDVRIHAIRRRPDRRRPSGVRWHAAGRARSRSFITQGLADSYRAELIRAARKGLDFSPRTGEPASRAAPEAATTSWLEYARVRGRLRCDEMAPGGSAHPGRNRRRAGHHYPGSPHARARRAARSGVACCPLRTRVQPCPGRHRSRPGGRRGAGLGLASLSAADRPGRPAGDPARAGRPGAPPGWDPGRGHDHHPQAGRLRQLPRLRGRTRVAGSQPSGPHHMEAPEIVLLGRPAVNRHTCRGAGDPGRGHQDPPGADRVLRLPVLRGTATCRSRRAACRLLRPPLTRLGTADTHSVPPPVGACLDWQRHATRTAQPQTPPGRRHQDGPDPPAACPPPPLAPAGLRVRRRRAAVPGCPWRPAQRKPLRPDLAPGPRRSHAGGRDRRPAGAPPLRSASRRAVVGLASGAPPAEIAARAGHSVRVLLTIYAHCMPGCDQIASQHIEQALRPSR